MTSQKVENECEENTLKEQVDALVNYLLKPVEAETSSITSSYSECMDLYRPDCALNQNIDQQNENRFLFIGEHENQISEGGEADLHKHKKNCKKNPGHPEFIPIESFSLKHLPEGLRDSDLYEYIKAIADLTVHISVNFTSPYRPDFWPNSQIPYFLYNLRGKKVLRTGSGRVNNIQEYTDEKEHRKLGRTTCPCDKCKASDKPSKVWWEIDVETAAHVIFDNIEARQTQLRLFYDREDSEFVILKGNLRVYDKNIKEDWCRLMYVTCDENLARKLKKIRTDLPSKWKKVYKKYNECSDMIRFCFVVSHPHGCNKQISVGQWKEKQHVREGNDRAMYAYTTCTCPGSSGAYVHCQEFNGGWFSHAHSGSLKNGLNFCSTEIFPMYMSWD